MRKHIKSFNQINENTTSYIDTYTDILLNNNYIKCGNSWFKLESDYEIHFAWLFKSTNSLKMVGYKKEDGKEYGDKLYFISPNDIMNPEILQSIINNNIK